MGRWGHSIPRGRDKRAEPRAYLPEVWRRSPLHRSPRSPHSRSPIGEAGRSQVGTKNPTSGREGSLWELCRKEERARFLFSPRRTETSYFTSP